MQPDPISSVHTSNLPELLKQLNVSLVVTTYQAGRVILVRYDQEGENGGTINTHFQTFDKPMGVCVKGGRLGIGGTHTVWEYRNVPAAVDKLDPPHKHDACFVPRGIHFTGNIDIHEMAWSADDQLWLVNTRFSCLCTIDGEHSFYPRWRPPFVSALSPEDRCHLNGLALRDGAPRYVTALGETDTRGGWRANKVSGGMLMDIESGDVIVRGLSMPHSPRWYREQLWVLESGKGSLSAVDPTSGEMRTVASLPGFTRGIDFMGPLAFVGLSKVRETAVFSGLPITRELTERHCGIWVVNIETGDTLGFLRFESGVEEIFAVQLLRDTRFPEFLPADSPLTNDTYVVPDAVLADVVIPSRQDFEESPHGVLAQGVEHYRQQDFEKAVAAFRECLARQADFPDARYGLGIALAEGGEWQEALAHLQAAVDREPDRADIQMSLGSLYQRMGRFDEAQRAFEMAIQRQPEDAAAHVSLGVLLLQLGDYSRGFEEYEWRSTGGLVPTLSSPHPVWDGQPATGKILLVYLEHDDPRRLILLMRLIPVAAAHFRKVVVTCPDRFAPLLSSLSGIDEVRLPGAITAAEFDVKVSLDSLPFLLHVTGSSIPSSDGCLNLDVLRRRSRDGVSLPGSGRAKVGLVWADGAPDPQNPKSPGPIAHILHRLCRARAADADFYDLTDPAARDTFTGRPDELRVPESLRESAELTDLALLIGELDLVIGVDTAPVHLAAALDKPTWVVLDGFSEWYWPSSSSRSGWYPATRIFRQRTPQDSSTLAGEIHAAFSATALRRSGERADEGRDDGADIRRIDF